MRKVPKMMTSEKRDGTVVKSGNRKTYIRNRTIKEDKSSKTFGFEADRQDQQNKGKEKPN